MIFPRSASTHPQLLFANFNQDFSCISVGTRSGYSIINCDPFGRVFTKNEGAVGIVEMLFCTSLVALVGAADQPTSSPRQLKIVNTKRQSTICELLFPTTILAVKLNRKVLAVVLEAEIYLYDISNMKLLHVIETSPNPNAICALSPSATSCYLAYPSPIPSPSSTSSVPPPTTHASQSGDVIIFSPLTLTITNVVHAHKTPISCLALSSNGQLLATASEKGTIIRVFALPSAQKVAQFRRGTRESRIHSMNFNNVGTLLAVSSASETVHVFRLDDKRAAASVAGGRRTSGTSVSSGVGSALGEEDADSARSGSGAVEGGREPPSVEKQALSLTGMLSRHSLKLAGGLVGQVGSMLPIPTQVSEMWEPARDFAYLKLPGGAGRCVVALSGTMPQVMVISSDGYFYAYNIDLENGGECVLMKQYSLVDSGDDNTGE
ncbi:WD40 repeat-like protein [Dacryopinax primogenitus]|uniref:Autophagy-related protein 18 n=1 Tax=Dacryopinax primogenitus (strain DJM 731) TaxID=1858805 RepID=M5FQX2_DACPD|nr:WD40 repeat-like protein [Dacryopinax primogenitus]EJT99405.1 WD40 repeat-like protein [Dacryopinax primogenitus]